MSRLIVLCALSLLLGSTAARSLPQDEGLKLAVADEVLREEMQLAAWLNDVMVHKGHFAGSGTCDPPIVRNNSTREVHVRCLGPAISLNPGQAGHWDTEMLLASPYPPTGMVAVSHMSAQMVDSASDPVLLSDVYVHHYVGNRHFLLGEGAELRGSMSREPLPRPFSIVVDGETAALPETRMTNIQLIDTRGVAPRDMRRCLECWCDEERTRGSFRCCRDCPSQMEGPPADVFLEYNVTYRPIAANDSDIIPVDFIGYDVTDGRIEYNLPAALGPDKPFLMSREFVVDENCPQKAPFALLRCTGHQHVGGQCLRLWDVQLDELLCESCPVYGTEEGAPGNEEGYVVKMQDGDVWPPRILQPGARLRLESRYDGSEPRLGLMGFMTLWFGNLTNPCRGPFQTPMLGLDYGTVL